MRRQIVTIDCETDPFKYGRMPEPFIWGFYNGRDYLTFDKTSEIVNFLKDKEYIVYAHNGGKFDYHFLLPFMNTREKIMIINSRLAKWRLGKCELRDSYNILPVPLAHINKDTFDYNKMERSVRHEHMDEIKHYLRNDCKYLYDAITDFIDRYGLHLTQAGAAMKQWQKLGNEAPRTSGAYFESVRPFYYGGRVTAFKTGIFNGNFDIIDINSAYPRAMREKHPWGLQRVLKKQVTDTELPTALLEVECTSYGALPQRQQDKSLSFPEGHGRYYITGHEFIAGIETNTIRNAKIIRAHIWADLIDFEEYVSHFYEMKLTAERTGDKAGRLFAKLLMNSLYGKFASNPEKYREYIIDDYGEETPEGYQPDAILGQKQLFSRPLKEEIQRYFNVAVSASITGWVRAYLWRSINKVSNPLYCDTDSIICTNHDKLPLGDQLGQWSIEGKARQVAIAGKKLYACKLNDNSWKCASKGARLTPQEIIRVANGTPVTYRSEAPTFSLSGPSFFLQRRIARAA